MQAELNVHTVLQTAKQTVHSVVAKLVGQFEFSADFARPILKSIEVDLTTSVILIFQYKNVLTVHQHFKSFPLTKAIPI